MTSLSALDRLDPAVVARLEAEGVSSIEELLDQGATPRGRRALSRLTGIDEPLVRTLVNHADLFRVKGVAGQMAELLHQAGVESVPELARRDPHHLHEKLVEVNERRQLVGRVPSVIVVSGWVAEAKHLPKIVLS